MPVEGRRQPTEPGSSLGLLRCHPGEVAADDLSIRAAEGLEDRERLLVEPARSRDVPLLSQTTELVLALVASRDGLLSTK
jgi:hypothetical protein